MKKPTGSYKGKKSLRRNIVLTVLCVLYIPVLLMGFTSYYSIQRSLESELLTNSANDIQLTVNSMELLMGQIYDGCKQLSADGAVDRYLAIDNKIYFENLDITTGHDARRAYGSYFTRKHEAIGRMYALESSSRYISSLYLYSYELDMALSANGWTYAPGEIHGADWKPVADSAAALPAIIPPSAQGNNRAGRQSIIVLLAHSPLRSNIFVVYLDADMIYNNVIGRTGGDRLNDYIVLAGDGGVIFSAGMDNAAIAAVLSGFAPSPDGGGARCKLPGDDRIYYVTHKRSGELGWDFYNVKLIDNVLESLDYMRLALIAGLCFASVLLTALAWFSTRLFYKPIRVILGMIGDNDKTKAKDVRSGWELESISSFIAETSQERKMLESKLAQSIPAYHDAFLLSLVKGKTADPGSLKEKADFLGVDVGICKLLPVVAVMLANDRAVREQYMNLLWVKKILARIFEDNYTLEICGDESDRVLMLFNCEEPEAPGIGEMLETACLEVENAFQAGIVFGMGPWCRAAGADLKHSYDMAVQALKHGVFNNTAGVYQAEDARIGAPEPLNRINDGAYNYITNHIRIGDGESAVRMFLQLLKDNAANGAANRAGVHKLFGEVLFLLQDVAHETGMPFDFFEDGESSIFDRFAAGSEAEITQWLKDAIIKTAGKLKTAIREMETVYCEKVVDMLEKDCGRYMSLQSVSEALNISPAHLSRVFREKMGVTFIDYLTKIRIEKAKCMLVESDQTVRVISEYLGYSSDSYLNRLFKKIEGITPQEYRGTFRLQKDNKMIS